MPLYTYKCPHCESSITVFKKIAEIDRVELCPRCSTLMQRQISAPAVQGDYPGYNCPITGDWIEGRAAHEANLHKHGCRVFESGETEAMQANKRRENQALDTAVDNTVEEFIHKLPAQSREKLFEEVQQGAAVAVERT